MTLARAATIAALSVLGFVLMGLIDAARRPADFIRR